MILVQFVFLPKQINHEEIGENSNLSGKKSVIYCHQASYEKNKFSKFIWIHFLDFVSKNRK